MMRPILTAIIFSLLFNYSASAIDLISTNSYELALDEVLDSESWIYAQTGIVAGTVSADIFVLADRLELSGGFAEDIWALATRANFSGKSAASVRLAGQQVLVSGQAEAGLTAIAETVKIENSANAGEVLLIGSDVIFQGGCSRDATIIANRATLDGRFGGSVRVIATDIVVSSDCQIAGDLVYTSPEELFLPARSIVSGQLIKKVESARSLDWKAALLNTATTQAMWFLAALMVGLPLMSLLPMPMLFSVNALRTSAWRCLLIGLATFILAPLFAILMLGSIVGIPLALITAALYGILVYIAKYPVAILLGVLILRRRGGQTNFRAVLLVMAVGLAIMYILTALPYIGGTIRFIVTVYGLGALLGTALSKRRTVIRVDSAHTQEQGGDSN
jgi:cytoskeletal protein CcmA (bactofilin family)